MKAFRFLVAILATLALPGCHLAGYERRYSIGVENREGERIDFGVSIIPLPKVEKSSK